jgi:drug/metabolite transporter (DMT)-like permease
MSQLLAIASAVLFGLGDFTGGVATRRVPVWTVLAWSQLIGLAVLAVGLLVVPVESVTGKDVLFGAAAGLAGVVGLAILYTALAAGTMSIVAPMSGAVAAAFPVVVDIADGARLSSPEWLGVLLAVVAVLLVGLDRNVRGLHSRVLVQAVVAGVAFGLFFIAIAQTSEDSGLWPLVAARGVTLPVAMLMAGLAGGLAPPRGQNLRLAGAAGSLDMAANVSIALSLQKGPLGVNAVLSSLYPAFTAVAAVVALRERPTAQQAAGITLALGAVIALAV